MPLLIGLPGHLAYDIVFIVAAGLAIGSALAVVLFSNPFHSALSLILNLVALATLYLLLQADFVAAAQVIVYAGAVMIMFLFVTAYLGGRADEPTRSRPVWETAIAAVTAVFLMAEVIFAVVDQSLSQGPVVADSFGDPRVVGLSFLGRYLLAFEATSILLMVAAVGGVVLGSRRAAQRRPGERSALERELRERERSTQSKVVDVETRFEVARASGGEGTDD